MPIPVDHHQPVVLAFILHEEIEGGKLIERFGRAVPSLETDLIREYFSCCKIGPPPTLFGTLFAFAWKMRMKFLFSFGRKCALCVQYRFTPALKCFASLFLIPSSSILLVSCIVFCPFQLLYFTSFSKSLLWGVSGDLSMLLCLCSFLAFYIVSSHRFQVTVSATNNSPGDIIDSAVFGFVYDEEGTSVVANNPDGASDAGQVL